MDPAELAAARAAFQTGAGFAMPALGAMIRTLIFAAACLWAGWVSWHSLKAWSQDVDYAALWRGIGAVLAFLLILGMYLEI